MSTSCDCDCSSLFLLAVTAWLIISCMLWVSLVYSTSHTHFLSRWCQSFSSGKYFSSGGLLRACFKKSSIVRPSIYGTADTFTAERLMYYRMMMNFSYLLSSTSDLFQEENVHSVHLRQVCFAFLREEVEYVSLWLYFLHQFMDVDFLQSLLWCSLIHWLGILE